MVRNTPAVSVKFVRDELHGAEALLQAQKLAGLDASTVLESMFNSIMAKYESDLTEKQIAGLKKFVR